MSFDYAKLRGKIREVYGTEAKLAAAAGLGRVSLSQRLNNHVDFSQGDINLIANILGIPPTEISQYFFSPKVQKHERVGEA